MKAALFHGVGQIEYRNDVAKPSAAAGEVLVRVASCGICGSDLHIYRMQSRATEDMLVSTLRVDPDGRRIIGHEYAGVIAEVGAGVADWRLGDRVVGVTAGGGMAEYVPVPVNPYQLARIPDGVSFEEAATAEPMADSLQMVRKALLQPRENVVVFGVGIIGLGVIQALRALVPDIGRIVAVDVSEARLAAAVDIGASAAVNPVQGDVVAAVGRVCGTVPNAFPPMNPPDVAVVFDCAGYIKHMKGPPPLQTALDLLRPRGGRIVCFGAFEDDVTLNLMHIINKEPVICGSLGYLPQDLTQGLELMAQRKVDRRKLVSHRFAVEEASRAFETQASGQAIKVMVRPDAALNG